MFAPRYFAPRYFAPRYFTPGLGVIIEVVSTLFSPLYDPLLAACRSPLEVPFWEREEHKRDR